MENLVHSALFLKQASGFVLGSWRTSNQQVYPHKVVTERSFAYRIKSMFSTACQFVFHSSICGLNIRSTLMASWLLRWLMQNVAMNILEFSGVWSFHGYVNESYSATNSFTCCRVSRSTEVYANPLGVCLNLYFRVEKPNISVSVIAILFGNQLK